MEIYNKNYKTNYLLKIKNKFSGKRIFIIILFLFGVGIFGFSSIIFGAYLNSKGKTYDLKIALNKLSNFDFSFIPNSISGQFTKIEELDIDVSFKNWERIRYNRERVFLLGDRIPEIYQEEVPAKIRYKNNTYKVKIKLIRDLDHLIQPTKWSLMVKVKGGKTIMGMNKFALLYPKARGYLTDWIASKLLKSRGIIGLQSGFTKININGKNHGLYYIEERFGDKLIENNQLLDGIVFRSLETELKIYDYKKLKEYPKKLKSIILLKKLWQSFLLDSIKPEQLFDLKKYASLYVISDIMYNSSEAHALFYGNSRMYFNPITNLIEPIPREWGDLRLDTRKQLEKLIIENRIPDSYEIQKRISEDLLFKELYFKEAEELTKPYFLDSLFISHRSELKKLSKEIHSINPFYSLPINILYENQFIIRKKLHPKEPLLEVYLDSISVNNNLIFKINNKTDFPLEIKRLIYNDSELIEPKNRIIIDPKYVNSNNFQSISLPLDPKSDIDLNRFSSDSVEVVYSILGINETYNGIQKYIETSKTLVFPKKMSHDDFLKLNPSKKPINIYDFDFIKTQNKEIVFSSDVCEIKKDLIIPKGYKVKVNPGCKINLINSSKIISYSPLKFNGTEEKPITITSSDSSGQGIIIFSKNKKSELSFVNFKYLSDISDNGWDTNGIITFYESPVIIKNCSFSSNIKGDTFLHIVRSEFIIFNSFFKNISSNALKIEYSSGSLDNLIFKSVNKNAISNMGSKISLNDIRIENINNVGILSGNNSSYNGNRIFINKSNIAIVCKGNAKVNITKIKIDSCNLALSTFREKSEYKSPIVELNNINIIHSKKDYLIEKNSILNINGKFYIDRINKVEKILNDEYYK